MARSVNVDSLRAPVSVWQSQVLFAIAVVTIRATHGCKEGVGHGHPDDVMRYVVDEQLSTVRQLCILCPYTLGTVAVLCIGTPRTINQTQVAVTSDGHRRGITDCGGAP